MAAAVARVQGVLGAGRYLHLPYTTLFEYLKVLEEAGQGSCSVDRAQGRRSRGHHILTLLSCPPARPQYLRAIAAALAPGGPAVLFYLAAAVSDFFMPWADMVRGAGGGGGRALPEGSPTVC